MASRLEKGLKLMYFKRPGPFDAGKPGEHLPEAYRKFWNEWKVQKPEPVHYIPEPGKWKRNPQTGEVTPVQNIPIPVKFPVEAHNQLWGGEGVIKGFQKRDPCRRRVPHFWVPVLKRSVVYSEILDKYMSIIVTERTIALIHKNYGFDHYILKTPACDLKSELSLKIKRRLLQTLDKKDMFLDNAEKREDVYNRYKDYLSSYSKEDLDWYGLSYTDALKKLARERAAENHLQPLKLQYRHELLQQLVEKGGEEMDTDPPLEGRIQGPAAWLSKLNPFGSKKQDSPTKT